MANLFINKLQDGSFGFLFVKLTGHHFSFAPGKRVVHIGFLGHLPSCNGIGSCGIGGIGASIVRVAPIGFSFQDLAETTFFSTKDASIFTARAIGFPFAKGPTLICSSSALILYFPALKYLVSILLPVLFPGLLYPLFLMITSSPPSLISLNPLPISTLPFPSRFPI